MITDHRNLRKLRHACKQVHEIIITSMVHLRQGRMGRAADTMLKARDTLRLALEETAPEPDPGDALDAAEIHPHAPER